MEKAARRARLEYHRSHLLYYRKHNGPVARLTLRLRLAARGARDWVRGRTSGNPEVADDGAAVLRMALGS